MEDIFASCRQNDGSSSSLINDEGLAIFRKIAEFKKSAFSIPEIRKKILSDIEISGGHGETKPESAAHLPEKEDKTKDIEKEIVQKNKKIDELHNKLETEMQKRVEREKEIRFLQEEIERLTGGRHLIEFLATHRTIALRRATLLKRLEGLRFWQYQKKKQLIQSIRELDNPARSGGEKQNTGADALKKRIAPEISCK